MTPELSRWAARVVNAHYFRDRREEQERFRAEVVKYETLADLPSDLRTLGTTALKHG